MGFSAVWYVPEQVLYVTFNGDVTASDLHCFNEMMLRSLNKSHRRIHLLIHTAAVSKTQPTAHEITTILTFLRHRNTGRVFVVEATALTRFIISIVGQSLRFPATFHQDTPTALTALKTLESNLQLYEPPFDY